MCAEFSFCPPLIHQTVVSTVIYVASIAIIAVTTFAVISRCVFLGVFDIIFAFVSGSAVDTTVINNSIEGPDPTLKVKKLDLT